MFNQVYAQFGPVTDPLGSNSPQDIGAIFGFIINLILGIGWGLVFVMGALGFTQYIISKGEKTAVEGARNWLTSAAIGGAGLFLLTSVKVILPTLLGATGTEGPVTGMPGLGTF